MSFGPETIQPIVLPERATWAGWTRAAIIAEMATTTPLKRVYFDSNPLHNWPNGPNELWNALSAARWLGSELYLPVTVEDELEAQFIRGVQNAYDAIDGQVKVLRKLCRNIIDPNVSGQEPAPEVLAAAFRERSRELKEHFKMESVPLTKVPLSTMLTMAIGRMAPFEEIRIDEKHHAIVGLQDAAILLSILGHMKSAAPGERCAFVTSDSVFSKAETRELIESQGVKLEILKSVRALWEDSFNHFWPEIREKWHEEERQIEAELNQRKDDLAREIVALLNASDLGAQLWITAKVRKGISVREFSMVSIELPDSGQRPPHARYHRRDGEKVKISARATVEMEAVVEQFNWLTAFGGLGSERIVQEPPKFDEKTLSETLNVSLLGEVVDGVIQKIEVTGVERYRP